MISLKLPLLGLTTLAALALTLGSCAPVQSSAVRHSPAPPVYTAPETWGSGGHYTGFAPSRPSAHGYETGTANAPC